MTSGLFLGSTTFVEYQSPVSLYTPLISRLYPNTPKMLQIQSSVPATFFASRN
jgi:hypothetical protein